MSPVSCITKIFPRKQRKKYIFTASVLSTSHSSQHKMSVRILSTAYSLVAILPACRILQHWLNSQINDGEICTDQAIRLGSCVLLTLYYDYHKFLQWPNNNDKSKLLCPSLLLISHLVSGELVNTSLCNNLNWGFHITRNTSIVFL